MIVEAILNMFKGVIIFIIGLIPAFPDLSFLIGVFSPLINFIKTCNVFIDVSFFAKCLLVAIVFLNIRLIWSAIMWIVRKIPGVS